MLESLLAGWTSEHQKTFWIRITAQFGDFKFPPKMTDNPVLGSKPKPSPSISKAGGGETRSRTELVWSEIERRWRDVQLMIVSNQIRHWPGPEAPAPEPALPLYTLVWSGLASQSIHTVALASPSHSSAGSAHITCFFVSIGYLSTHARQQRLWFQFE